MGKTTVEILDKGEETPRSPTRSVDPACDISGSSPPKASQVKGTVLHNVEIDILNKRTSLLLQSRRVRRSLPFPITTFKDEDLWVYPVSFDNRNRCQYWSVRKSRFYQ